MGCKGYDWPIHGGPASDITVEWGQGTPGKEKYQHHEDCGGDLKLGITYSKNFNAILDS